MGWGARPWGEEGGEELRQRAEEVGGERTGQDKEVGEGRETRERG